MSKYLAVLIVLLIHYLGFSQTITGNTTICQGQNTTLGVTGATGTYKWERSTDNGTTWTQVGTNSTYVANTAGLYRVTVGTQVSNVVEVVVNSLPTASFTFSPNSACAKTPVAFTNTSTGGVSYLWSYNDGGTITTTTQNPTFSFNGSTGNGTQNINVSLTVTNSNGCVATSTQPVTIKQRPGAELNGPNPSTYKGETYFTSCTGTQSVNLNFTSNTSTKNTNTNYQLIWGDNTASYNNTTFNGPTSHTYTTGTYPLNFVVTGGNGCIDTGKYYVFIGSNPSVGLGNPGNTNICTGSSLTFPINTVSGNPPGTEYIVSFNDGTSSLTFAHPPPNDVTHTFNKTSCGTTSDGYSNAFLATVTAANPCQSSKATVVPIYVSQKPTASFTVSPKDTICIGTPFSATNTSLSTYVTNQGCVQGRSVWSISPATGWTSGSSFGSDNGVLDPSLWNTGATTISINFTAAGTYTIKLKVGNPICGLDSVTRVICVNPTPTGSFNIDKLVDCAPFVVNGTSSISNATCGSNYLVWNVTYTALSGCTPTVAGYSFVNGTTSSSATPSFQFTNPGTYNVSAILYAPGGTCSNPLPPKTVTVKGKPNVTNSVPTALCQNTPVNFTSSATCNPGNTFTYAWTFPSGMPASSSLQNPTGITFNTSGTVNVSLSVTNECGTTVLDKPLNVTPIPNVSGPGNLQFCAGQTTGIINLTSSTPGATVTWNRTAGTIGLTQTSGNGNIPSFTATNSGSSPITSIFTVTASTGGCSTSTTFSLTVNPLPAQPTAPTTVFLCQGAAAAALTATPTTGNTLLWYTSTTGTGSPTAPTPSTATVGTTNYWVTQVNSTTNCESTKRQITVTVTATPVIAATATSTTSCTAPNGTIRITGLLPNTTYTVQYSKDGVLVTLSNQSSGTAGVININNLGAGVYSNISVTLNSCMSAPVGPFTFTDPNPPTAPTIAGNNSPLCSGATLSLSATGAGTGVTYQWSGPNSFSSTSANPTIPNVTVAASGTYSVRTLQNGCSSGAVTTTVVVNQTPSQPTASSNTPLCVGATLSLTATVAGSTSVTYNWSGPAGFTSTQQNPIVPNVTTTNAGTYSVSVVSLPGGCSSSPRTTNVAVNAIPTFAATFSQTTSCTAPNGSITLTGLQPGASFTVQYTKDGTPVTVTNRVATTAGVVTIGNLGSGVYNNITVTLNGCTSSAAGPFTIVDPNPPAAPIISATNSPVCAGGTLSLVASGAPAGAGYSWTGPNSFVSTSATATIANVTTAASGTYTVRTTQNGCSSASVTTTVTVNATPALPTATSNSPICSGGTLSLSATAAGTGSFTYAWSGPNGFTSSSQNPTIQNVTSAAAGSYSVTVSNGNCASAPRTIAVQVSGAVAISGTSSNNPTTCGSTTGSITLNGLTANVSYVVAYKKNGTPVNTTITANSSGAVVITGLTAGVYTEITVTQNGCTSSQVGPFTLIDPNPPATPVAVASSPVCAGSTLTLTATTSTQGTASYTWTGPNNFSSTLQSPTIPNVTTNASGTYLVTVRVNGCTSAAGSVSITIASTPALTSIASNSPLCSGGTLSLTAVVSVGGNFNYQWSGPNNFTSTDANPIISNVTSANSGTYSLILSNGSCGSTSRSTVVQIAGATTIAGSLSTNPTACATSTGSISLSGLTQNQSYTINYSKNGTPVTGVFTSNSTGTLIIPGLTSGVYADVSVSSAGCKSNSVGPFTLSDPNSPAAPVASSNGPLCAGQTLNLTATSNSQGIVTYLWTGPNNFTSSQQNPTINNITQAGSGTYQVTVNQNGCTSPSTIVSVLVNNTTEKPNVNSNSPICTGKDLVLSATVNMQGSVTYSWTGPNGWTSNQQNPTLPNISTLASGAYTVIASVGNNCASQPSTVNVSVTNPPSISGVAQNPTSCATATGAINVNGLTPNLSYTITYSKDGQGPITVNRSADPNGTLQINNLPAGTYDNITALQNGCPSNIIGPFTLTETNAPPAPVASTTGPICAGQTLQLSASSPVSGNVTYQWTGPNGFTSNQQNPTIQNASVAASGNYQVTASAAGCGSAAATVSVTVSAAPSLITTQNMNLCRGQSTQLTVQGATNYQWSPMNGLSCSNCSNPTVTPNTTTTYVVEGRNSIGCKSYDTVTITVIQPFKMTVSANDTICTGGRVNLSATGAPRYQWSPSQGLSSTTTGNPVATPTVTTHYMVVGYDDHNCFTDTGRVTIAVGQVPTVDLGPDLFVTTGTKVQLTPVITNGPIKTWSWTPTANLSCSNCPSPEATIKNDISYRVKVTNIYGCTATDDITIKVSCDASQVFIPNAFTPDGDGINDILMVRAKGVSVVKFFRVFTRWGELIFEKTNFVPNDPAFSWDGKIRGVKAPPDVFVYTVEITCDNGATFNYKGNVSILK